MPTRIESQPVARLSDYPDRFLTCRMLMHAWDNDGFPWIQRQENSQVVYEKMKCLRCPVVRVDQRTMMGRLLRRTYRYPDGYRLSLDTRSKEPIARERIVRFRAADHLSTRQA